MEPILRVENLRKTFSRQGQADFAAVNGIDFELFPGECLAIIGESGSGKTTAVNLIARLLDATSGSVFLDGREITHLRGRQLRQVYKTMQMVFQTPTDSFDPRRTLGDGIGESLRNAGVSRKETRERVGELLKKCGVKAIWNFTKGDLARYEASTLIQNVHLSDSLITLCYRLTELENKIYDAR